MAEEPMVSIDELVIQMKSMMSDLGNKLPFKEEEFKNSIKNLLSFFTSEEQRVAIYASEQMTVILSVVEKHEEADKLSILLPMKDPSFIELINKTDNYRILACYLINSGKSNHHSNNALVMALPLFDGFSKKGVWRAISSSDIQYIIKCLLNRVKEVMKKIDNLKDQEQQHIVNFIKKLHSFLADRESEKLCLIEEIKTCHELTKGMLDWYKKENRAIGYCEISQSYKSMMKSSIALLEHCDKDQLKKINVTANLFRLQLITDEGKIKPEILFELVKLVALVKSTDKNTKLDSFYQEFPTNLGLEEQESKEALYDLWAKAWKEKKTIGFLAPTTEQKKNLVAALQLISDAGILISPEHSRLLPRSGIGHNASFTQLSLN